VNALDASIGVDLARTMPPPMPSFFPRAKLPFAVEPECIDLAREKERLGTFLLPKRTYVLDIKPQ
jgi:hypothetical protein